MMWDIMTTAETKLLFPGLAGFYASWRDIAYTALRVIVGYILLMHGWLKVGTFGLAGVSGFMAKAGLEPAAAFAVAAMFLETVGAICIIVGLFTRFFAAALAIELLIGLLAGAFQGRIFRQQRWIRIHSATRHSDVRHRDPRWRALLDRSPNREGIVEYPAERNLKISPRA
jgi:uncharacterized membrane protein YphA (DoxX/SURF4 family)